MPWQRQPATLPIEKRDCSSLLFSGMELTGNTTQMVLSQAIFYSSGQKLSFIYGYKYKNQKILSTQTLLVLWCQIN